MNGPACKLVRIQRYDPELPDVRDVKEYPLMPADAFKSGE